MKTNEDWSVESDVIPLQGGLLYPREERRPKVLIVEDDKVNMSLLRDILAPQYDILTAENGMEALEIATSSEPDIILLDIILPDISGFDVLVKLKNMPTTRPIPVICVTGLSEVANEEKGFMLGAVDYITKPYHNSIVLARVKTHLQIVGQMKTIEQLGMLDPLTNLSNRRNFETCIKAEWKRAAREKTHVSLLGIDVDDFKKYNDTYGHPQGDILLQKVAEVFSNAVKRGADLVARLGGEEFSVLLPNTSLAGAIAVAEKIRSRVEALAVYNYHTGESTFVTVSIGAAEARPSEGSTIVGLVSDADKALYRAKSNGKNIVCTMDDCA